MVPHHRAILDFAGEDTGDLQHRHKDDGKGAGLDGREEFTDQIAEAEAGAGNKKADAKVQDGRLTPAPGLPGLALFVLVPQFAVDNSFIGGIIYKNVFVVSVGVWHCW